MSAPACLGCSAPLARTWVDLGMQPLSNAFVPPDRAAEPDALYPLHARVCDACLLVQVDRVVPPDAIFNDDYAYFSSYSESWLAHCRDYVAEMCSRFDLGRHSQVVEIASNDGYMLQYFVGLGVPVLGVEPSANTAAAAVARGVPTEVAFFGLETANRLPKADLIAAKNVMAHVPDINDFAAGIAAALKPEGVFTVEFPHLLKTIEGLQFDQVYHEHFTYLSLLAVERVLARAGLRVFDAARLATHGGSLRVFACHAGAAQAQTPAVGAVLADERTAGLDRPEGYAGFQAKAEAIRDGLRGFLEAARRDRRTVLGYGAAAKGNTLLNFAGVGPDLLPFIADRSAAKQGRLCPGSRVPVRAPDDLIAARPDHVLILPWNIRAEIETQLAAVRGWGGGFVVAVPELRTG